MRCTSCGTALQQLQDAVTAATAESAENPTDAKPKSRRRVPIVAVIVFAVVCIGAIVIAVLSGRTKPVEGIVDGVEWERTIAIEAFGPVEHNDWIDELPADAENISCEQEHRYTSDQREANSIEVCGTPYNVDKGDGFAEVVQDCEYEVYDDYCSYTIMAWSTVDKAVLTGNDLNPVWPNPNLTSDQRLGDDKSETYSVVFDTGADTYSYSADDVNDFLRFDRGSTWTLNVNTFGIVLSVER